MMSRRTALVAVTLAATLGALPACSSSSSSGSGGSGGASDGASKTITIAYQKFGAFTQMDSHMTKVKAEYEAAHPGMTVKLNPIQADENDYYTKLNLMNRTASTAPDVLYEDTFLVNSDIDAGYLAPLDDYAGKWADWSQFTESAQGAGKGADGKLYGIPMGTDTRALYYNKEIFAKAGLPTDWQPKSWDDILAAAAHDQGQGARRAALQHLLGQGRRRGLDDAGPGDAALRHPEHALRRGRQEVDHREPRADRLVHVPQDRLRRGAGAQAAGRARPAVGHQAQHQPHPRRQGRHRARRVLADAGPGRRTGPSRGPSTARSSGSAAMPTQHGEAPGATSMSGGWLLSVGAKSKNKDAAWDFVSLALNQENTKSYDIAASQISERKDVSADPEYLSSDPFTKTFTDLVQYTHFRPAYSKYPRVSDAIQTTMETVMTDKAPVDQALQQFKKTATPSSARRGHHGLGAS